VIYLIDNDLIVNMKRFKLLTPILSQFHPFQVHPKHMWYGASYLFSWVLLIIRASVLARARYTMKRCCAVY
jgi:hypothetical protein